MENELNQAGALLLQINNEIATLEKRLEELKRDRVDAERLFQRYGNQIILAIPEGERLTALISPVMEFQNLTLRECILKVMSRQSGTVRVGWLEKQIQAGGYPSKAKGLKGPIFGMIGRLIRDGKVKKVRRGVFRLAESRMIVKAVTS